MQRGLIVFARVMMTPPDAVGLEFGPLRGGRCKANHFLSAQPQRIFGLPVYLPYDSDRRWSWELYLRVVRQALVESARERFSSLYCL